MSLSRINRGTKNRLIVFRSYLPELNPSTGSWCSHAVVSLRFCTDSQFSFHSHRRRALWQRLCPTHSLVLSTYPEHLFTTATKSRTQCRRVLLNVPSCLPPTCRNRHFRHNTVHPHVPVHSKPRSHSTVRDVPTIAVCRCRMVVAHIAEVTFEIERRSIRIVSQVFDDNEALVVQALKDRLRRLVHNSWIDSSNSSLANAFVAMQVIWSFR